MKHLNLNHYFAILLGVAILFGGIGHVAANDHDHDSDRICTDFGPQTPRDISNKLGDNKVVFDQAPDYTQLNLCNIHTHTNAEHKGPEFSEFVNESEFGGYACNAKDGLSEAELAPVSDDMRYYENIKAGDTIEVHWVHSSCDVQPGEGLGSCLAEGCDAPLLRVEAQVFLLVNDEDALDFADFDYDGDVRDGVHQAQSIPNNTGKPVVFLGSTTGPKYTEKKCSPFHVTWSVRPQCAKLDINSLHRWAKNGNSFNEIGSHGVRQLVTSPELLSPIQ